MNLPRKSAAFLPLQNLPVGFFPGKSTPLWGKSALARESLRWLLLPTSTSESPNMKRAGANWASENMNKDEKTMKKQLRRRPRPWSIVLVSSLYLSLQLRSVVVAEGVGWAFKENEKQSRFHFFFLPWGLLVVWIGDVRDMDVSAVMEQTL